MCGCAPSVGYVCGYHRRKAQDSDPGIMRCTATTRRPENCPERTDTRCDRPIGHGGLHCIVYNGVVYEFPDSHCWFPHYEVGN